MSRRASSSTWLTLLASDSSSRGPGAGGKSRSSAPPTGASGARRVRGARCGSDGRGRRLLPLGELAAEDLAGRGARDLVDELDLADPLVVGDPLLHEGHQLVARHAGTGADLHEGLRDLARLRIRLADDARVGDGGMLAEHRLDLRRPDPEALVLDELLLAVDDEDVPVLVLLADVAGEEPAVPQHGRGVLGLVPVAAHDLRPADGDLAYRAGADVAQAALELDDAVLRPGDHRADRVEDRVIERVGMRDRRRLGEPIALDDRLPGPLAHATRRLRRERRGAAEEEADRAQVVLVDLGVRGQAEDDGRNYEAHRGAMPL